MGELQTRRAELKGLTGIRALAAAWVVGLHFRFYIYTLPGAEPLAPWVISGWLGVEVFFVLSGFIIAYNYADRFEKFSTGAYRKFLLLRVARIYPVHLVTLGAMLLLVVGAAALNLSLNSGNYTLGSFFGNVFMLHGIAQVGSWNPPAWTIAAEFLAYLAFPLIALWLVAVKKASTGFVYAGVVAVAGVSALLLVEALITNYDISLPLTFLFRIATEFTVGCLLFAGWRYLQSKQYGRHWDWIAMVALIATAIVLGVIGDGGPLAFITVPLIALFVLACAGATGWVGKLLSTRVMLWGGRISYSVYMTHYLLLIVLNKLVPVERVAEMPLLARFAVVLFILVVVVGVGAACYYVVEEPGRKLIRKLTTRPVPDLTDARA